MKIKKYLAGLLAGLVSLVSMPATVMTADAAADQGFTMEEIENSPVKPKVTISQKLITLDEAKASPEIEIELSVEGADMQYAATGFHILFDSRLEIEKHENGSLKVYKGEAIDYIYPGTPAIDYREDDSLLLSTIGDHNWGQDGVMWRIHFRLPEDVSYGDVYPIDIYYVQSNLWKDCFLDIEKSDLAVLMDAYTFTKGIYNEEYNNNFQASAEHIEKCKALADIDKSFDGYIAIADKEESTPSALLYGDANTDGSVDIADATLILQSIGNPDKYGLSKDGEKNADVVKDGAVTALDALAVQMYDAQMFTDADFPTTAEIVNSK